MFQLLGRFRAQGRRAVAMLVSVAAAVSAFLVLTASAESTSLKLTETVNANFRSSYDLLVRPAGTRTALERQDGLVRPNYLSGIFGGITQRQLRIVTGAPGVEVAAPIAMVGTVMESVRIPVDLTRDVGEHGRSLLRYSTTFESQRGLAHTAGQLGYVYVTPAAVKNRTPTDGLPWGDAEMAHGEQRIVCPLSSASSDPKSPFGVPGRWDTACWSRTGGISGLGWSLPDYVNLPEGHFGVGLRWTFPVTLAAIDPGAEARLTGLDEAMVEGRYLEAGEQEVTSEGGFADTADVPVIVAKDALVDEQAVVTVDRLPGAVADRLAGGVHLAESRRLVLDADGKRVDRVTIDASTAYDAWRQYATAGDHLGFLWRPSAVAYRTGAGGRLEPKPQPNDVSVWAEPAGNTGSRVVPSDAADTSYRALKQYPGDYGSSPLYASVTAVGTFDTAKLPGFSTLSQVPLETYQPPSAEPGDERTRQQLDGEDLLPNLNPAGYLQAPPLALTTLAAVDVFSSDGAFPTISPAAPISVIRVRVDGVTGTDDASRERIQLVANRIRERTGLDVDVTVGSSPAPKTIDLPASAAGAPALSIVERWTKKGVAFALVDGIDRKSLLLFLLVLVASGLTVVNAASASVRARRTEFGVLACLGWRPSKLYRTVCADLVAVGAAAGVLGAAAAIPLSALVDSPMPWARAALAVPTAIVLTLLAGLYPARLASRADPGEAIRPAVRTVRRAGRLHGIGSLAVAAVRRTPARAATGAAALALGVCAMAVLLGILIGFHGAAVGTLLGDAITVQVRTPDIIAASVIATLALIALADILYLDLHEQAPHYASLQASGWRDTGLARLIVTQAGLIAALGGLAGAAAAVGLLQLLGGLTAQTALIATGIALAGIALACLVALAPAASLLRLHPADFLTQE